jgi:hypothetical protein
MSTETPIKWNKVKTFPPFLPKNKILFSSYYELGRFSDHCTCLHTLCHSSLSCYIFKLHLCPWGRNWGRSSMSWTNCLQISFITSNFSHSTFSIWYRSKRPCSAWFCLLFHSFNQAFTHTFNKHINMNDMRQDMGNTRMSKSSLLQGNEGKEMGIT